MVYWQDFFFNLELIGLSPVKYIFIEKNRKKDF